MTDDDFAVLKARCMQALAEETSYCTAAYIAKKIGASEAQVFDALSELEDDDVISLRYAPCYFKYKDDFTSPDFEPIKDSRHCINRTDYEFWAPF